MTSKSVARLPWLFIVIAVLPIAYVPKFGIEYREIKVVLFWLAAAGMALSLARRSFSGRMKRVTHDRLTLAIFAGAIAYVTTQLCSIVYATNPGLTWERALTALAVLLTFRYAAVSRVPLDRVARWLCVPVSIVCLLVLARSYAGISLVWQGGGLGALVGERNSASIFLAQAFPLVVALAACSDERRFRWGYLFLASISLLCILLPRTRTAWGMVSLYSILSGGSWVVTRLPIWRRVVSSLAGCGVAAVAALSVIPNRLAWRSATPYTDSFLTMVSPASQPNGRFELWRVGLEMLSANPLLGVGGGNYPVLMRRYVPPSAIDPKVLAFLRNDLPLFNDYLQALVEVGIVGGALFFVFFLVTPVCLAIRNADNRTPSGVVASLSLFSCIGLALAGMLDYPLLRPETLFLFGLLLGAAVGERHQTHEELEKNGSGNARQLSAFLLIAGGVSLAGTAFVYTTSFALRMNVISERSIEALRVSWRAWPWDGQWNERYAVRLYEAGRYEEVTEYLDSRAELWPDDPATYLARAETALMRHEYEVAMQSYERALFEVPGGRCSWRARSYLERAANVRDLSLNLKQRALELLARCS